MQTNNTYSKPYPPEIVKTMEAIVGTPSGRKRWRMIASAWVNLNQVQDDGLTAKQAYLAAAERCEDKRDHLVDKFAELKSTETARDSGVREAMEMPAGLWGWITMMDMGAFSQDNPDAKKNMRKLREEFPEFCVTSKSNV
jgi:hypothetical protein